MAADHSALQQRQQFYCIQIHKIHDNILVNTPNYSAYWTTDDSDDKNNNIHGHDDSFSNDNDNDNDNNDDDNDNDTDNHLLSQGSDSKSY